MEITNFLKLLHRQRYILIVVPVIAIVITFFLTRNLPNEYTSKAQVATGLVDQSAQILNSRIIDQESRIIQEFQNLIQIMQSKRIMDQISYELILHDLTSNQPYKSPSKKVKELNASARAHAIDVFRQKLLSKAPLSLFVADEKGLSEVIESMGYDMEELSKNLRIYRLNSSDFIQVEFNCQDPLMSAFVVNKLCTEFIDYYTKLVKENQLKAVSFLDSVMLKKYRDLDTQITGLKSYKIQNRVLNLEEQAKQLYAQLGEYETKRQEAEQEIIAKKGAIQQIDAKFNPNDRNYIETILTKVNVQILETKDLINQANNNYFRTGDVRFRKTVDSLKLILTEQIQLISDKYISNPLVTKDALVLEKLKLSIELDLVQNSIESLNKEIDRLNQRFDRLVPHEAVIQGFENNIKVASDEYLEILKKFNQTSLDSKLSIRLRQMENAMPGTLQPSKKMLLVIIAGIVTFVFCVVVLFVLFYLDDTIKSMKDLANATQLPVLGNIDLLPGKSVNLAGIWRGDRSPENSLLRDQIRAARFEIEMELGAGKIALINSIKMNEGKTFFTINLAYAFLAAGKRVAVIDGNFTNPAITKFATNKIYIEDVFTGRVPLHKSSDNNVDVFCNKGSDTSILEIAKEADIVQAFDLLKKEYDIILIEACGLFELNRSKEWTLFVDKVFTVFQANQVIQEPKKVHVQYLKDLKIKFGGLVLNKTSVPYKNKGIRSALVNRYKR
ncbi:MAG: lipopolysaccharide biosynthesis protein [Bacteroidetes bacterium]|nr:MAG: lipopolysaccharide biosynthesis protein [Bacteroidota bacterium]